MTEPAQRPRALVVYESMYGNTRAIAEAIASGMQPSMDVTTCRVRDVTPQLVSGSDVLVVGAPVHAWGLSRPTTREAAGDAASKPGSGLSMEDGSDTGVREWLDGLRDVSGRFAAFDTRLRAPFGLSGSAARKIERRLRRAGLARCAAWQAFRVSRHNHLRDGELDRARVWGRHVATRAGAGVPTMTTGQSK